MTNTNSIEISQVKSFLKWVVAAFLGQLIPSFLSISDLNFNTSILLISATVLCATGVLLFKTESAQRISAKLMILIGLATNTLIIILGFGSPTVLIYNFVWLGILVYGNQKKLFSKPAVDMFSVVFILFLVITILFKPVFETENNLVILVVGLLLVCVNIYLIYSESIRTKNNSTTPIQQPNFNELTSKLSKILAKDEPIEKILWYICQECVPYLNIEECVFYLYDEKKNKLVQVAAFGNKSDLDQLKVIDPIELNPGQGIVGKCFQSGQFICLGDTTKSDDYIVDDLSRNSELAVPIISQDKVIGVFDSEHSQVDFFKEIHLQSFQIIAAFCGVKIMDERAKTSLIEAARVLDEAQKIKELDELKSKFIANISHDLRTPISLIKSPAIQIGKIANDPKIVQQAQYILKNTEHLIKIVDQLLQLKGIDHDSFKPEFGKIELSKLIRKIEMQYRVLAEKDNIDFKVDVDAGYIHTDSFHLEQIIHNLISNAFRFVGKKGKVALSAMSKDGHLHILVANNGPNIPSDLHEKIFNRFFKIDINNHEGTGIGLSIVKEYAESLGGKAFLKTSNEQITEFEVIIPLDYFQETENKNFEQYPEWIENSKPVFLVVEDHPELNEFICTSFDDEYSCLSAFNGHEALDLLEKFAVDIIITDLMMPKMDGNSFVQTVRQDDTNGHVPIIVLSAKDSVSSKLELYETGIDNYLTKPFDIEELQAVVKSTLENRKKVRAAFGSSYLTENEENQNAIYFETKNKIVEHVVAFVKENLDDSTLNVAKICETLSIGRNKLQREIREATSLSPVEFLRSIRLHEARKLLRQPGMHVSQAAYAVGFNNLSYFTRAYKQEFDELPSERN